MSVNSAGSRQVALVIHALYGGGAERLMSQLATRWAEEGHRVHLLTLSHIDTDRYEVAPQVVRHGLDLMRPSRGPFDGWQANVRRVKRLRGELAALQPDFILSFCDRMNIVAAAAATPLKAPLWVAEHSDPARQRLGWIWEAWRGLTYRALSRRTQSGCIALTDTIAQHLKRRFPVLTLRVIPPAITLPAHFARPVRSDEERPKRLLTLGRHSPEKNLVSLVHAWKSLQRELPDWKWIMAGDGPQHATLRQLRDKLGLQSSIDLPGWTDDPWPLYAEADLLALPSHYEGFPVGLLEAMHAGVPCVSAPASDSVRTLAKVGALYLSRSTDVEDLAHALRAMMTDGRLRSTIAARALQESQAYTWHCVGLRWNQLLREMTQTPAHQC